MDHAHQVSQKPKSLEWRIMNLVRKIYIYMLKDIGGGWYANQKTPNRSKV